MKLIKYSMNLFMQNPFKFHLLKQTYKYNLTNLLCKLQSHYVFNEIQT